jgi:hypothetical protein
MEQSGLTPPGAAKAKLATPKSIANPNCFMAYTSYRLYLIINPNITKTQP